MGTRIKFNTKAVEWIDDVPKECQICHAPIGTIFVDGRTQSGPWACMCVTCHDIIGVGLGTGHGQLYSLDAASDTFWKIWG